MATVPEVGFYLLASPSEQGRYDFACKLVEKIYRTGRFCYLLTESPQQSERLDLQLWTFRAGSFIPHQIYRGEAPLLQQTILIGEQPIPEPWQAIIVNLSAQYPSQLDKTERLLEVLDSSETSKQAGRLRYKHYQQLGCPIATHNM